MYPKKEIKLFRCGLCLDDGNEGVFRFRELQKHKHKLKDYWFIGNPDVYTISELPIPRELLN